MNKIKTALTENRTETIVYTAAAIYGAACMTIMVAQATSAVVKVVHDIKS